MRKREGIQPRYERETVDADALCSAEGNIKAVNSHDCRESTGVVDRGTSLWQSRELGRSYGLPAKRGRVAQLVNQKEAQQSMGSRMSS